MEVQLEAVSQTLLYMPGDRDILKEGRSCQVLDILRQHQFRRRGSGGNDPGQLIVDLGTDSSVVEIIEPYGLRRNLRQFLKVETEVTGDVLGFADVLFTSGDLDLTVSQ
jgi:hypothetical protein